jgi:hypothetical protein
MATDFTLSCAAAALYPGTASALFTLALDAAAGSNVSFALSDGGAGGSFASTPTVITTGNTLGYFTYTPAASAAGGALITITAVASGGLVKTHALALPINYPFSGNNATEIMDGALGMLGVLAAGEPIPGERLAQGLHRLNDLVDAMRTDALFAHGTETVTGTLKAGVRSLLIGPSGDLVTLLSPVEILDGSFFSVGTLDYPMRAVPQGAYNDIAYKHYNTIGPEEYWFNAGTPNATISFFPQAASDVPLSLQVRTELVKFADPTTRYGLPPGYKRMLSLQLANDWGPTFRRALTPAQETQRQAAVYGVQRANHSTPAVRPRPRGNILIGWES